MTPLGQRLRLESTGWRRSLRRWRGAILAFTFPRRGQMAGKGTREISVFVDESGSFDPEKEFFLSIQNLKKNFLKPTARKRHE